MGWKINKQKTVEVRKSYPKDKVWNKTVILYCTKDKTSFNLIPKEYQPEMKKLLGKVIGEFYCGVINQSRRYLRGDFEHSHLPKWKEVLIPEYFNRTCLTYDEIEEYAKDVNIVYEWHISDLKVYDKPKELGEFCKPNILSYDDWLYGIYNGKGGSTSSYESYKNIFKMKRPPQSWQYVEG